MKSYSEEEIFTAEEVCLLRDAELVVEALRDGLRCHEVARIVARVLRLPPEHMQDGKYGFVEHSWLWTKPISECKILTPRLGFPNILDVYCVGSLPLVRLVDGQHPSLPHVGWAYRPGDKRDDIQFDVVEREVTRLVRGVVNE